uniref:Ubiquitin-like protease family profile domain-containing protein n=1 Tax=Cannabis sativa TaxID=3483 RepID=A0A803Q6B2_CANSA
AFMYIGNAHEYLGPWLGINQANYPRQPKSQECGFYVLKYITDIVARANPSRYIQDQKV